MNLDYAKTEALFQNWVMGKVLIRQVRKRLYFFVAKDGDFVTVFEDNSLAFHNM